MESINFWLLFLVLFRLCYHRAYWKGVRWFMAKNCKCCECHRLSSAYQAHANIPVWRSFILLWTAYVQSRVFSRSSCVVRHHYCGESDLASLSTVRIHDLNIYQQQYMVELATSWWTGIITVLKYMPTSLLFMFTRLTIVVRSTSRFSVIVTGVGDEHSHCALKVGLTESTFHNQ